jgi:hypothetical protein
MNRRTNVSFTIATGRLPTRSPVSKSRPLRSCMPIVWNQPGVVPFSQNVGRIRVICPSLMAIMPVLVPPPVSSRTDDTAAERTPGTAAVASRKRSTRALRCSGGPPPVWRFNSATSSGPGTKPRGNWLSDANV